MKKIILLLMLSVAAFSCKNSEEKNNEETTTENLENAENVKAYKGDFIDSNGALVLMGTNFIYGVKRDSLSEVLSNQVAAIKKNDFDMVGVIVRGIVSKNTDNDSEWEEVITIKAIMRVSNKPSEVDIKLDETAKKK